VRRATAEVVDQALSVASPATQRVEVRRQRPEISVRDRDEEVERSSWLLTSVL